MVASAMALHAGVPMETVRKVIQEFAGVEHRIEYVCEKDGVAYYNDSKGTNPDAAIKGIQAMNRPTSSPPTKSGFRHSMERYASWF